MEEGGGLKQKEVESFANQKPPNCPARRQFLIIFHVACTCRIKLDFSRSSISSYPPHRGLGFSQTVITWNRRLRRSERSASSIYSRARRRRRGSSGLRVSCLRRFSSCDLLCSFASMLALAETKLSSSTATLTCRPRRMLAVCLPAYSPNHA